MARAWPGRSSWDSLSALEEYLGRLQGSLGAAKAYAQINDIKKWTHSRFSNLTEISALLYMSCKSLRIHRHGKVIDA